MSGCHRGRGTALIWSALVWSMLVLVGVLVTGCGSGSGSGPSAAEHAGRLVVVATTTQVADFTRNIGGRNVAVTQLLKPNVDPHDYEPSPAGVRAIADARVVVENGAGLESWLGDTVKASGFD